MTAGTGGAHPVGRGAAAPPNQQLAFDLLARAVARSVDAPWVCLSLLGEDGRLLAGSHGLPVASAMLISWPFARQVITNGRGWIVPDAARDPVASRAPAVRDGTVAAYLGVPIEDGLGMAVGALSVMDPKPRPWRASHLAYLRRMSAGVVRILVPARGRVRHVHPAPGPESALP